MRGSETGQMSDSVAFCVVFRAKDEVRHLGLREGDGHSQDNEKNRCSAIRRLPCPVDRSSKVIFGDNSYSGQGP